MENTFDITVRDIRRQDIIDSFFNSLKELRKTRPFVTQNEVIEHAARSTAPRFYVTFENARRFVSLLMRGKRLPSSTRTRLRCTRRYTVVTRQGSRTATSATGTSSLRASSKNPHHRSTLTKKPSAESYTGHCATTGADAAA